MLKYNEYIVESVSNKFKKGDKVIFTVKPDRKYYAKYNGPAEITFVYGDSQDKYSILASSVDGVTSRDTNRAAIMASGDELKFADGKCQACGKDLIPDSLFCTECGVSTDPQTASSYIEKQFKPKAELDPTVDPKPSEDATSINTTEEILEPGRRVVVNGMAGRSEMKNRKGTIKNNKNSAAYLIEFDEDDSKNQAKHSMLVNRNLVTAIDEPSIVVFKMGDKVQCVDKKSVAFDLKGEIKQVFEDDHTFMVDFKDSSGVVSHTVWMRPDQIKIVEFAKSASNVSFKRDIPVGAPEKKEEKPKEISEEEDEDEVTAVSSVPFKKNDLLEFSYKDFLLEEKCSTKDELIANKTKYEEALKDPNIQEFKKVFIERSLRTAEIIESYFDFLIHKIAKDELQVFRTVEQIENEDLLKTKTKVRASDSKELTQKYSFDQGIIAYWKFNDAVVFKTI